MAGEERAVFIRLGVKDADKALAEFRRLGITGVKAFDDLGDAADASNRKLGQMDRRVSGTRRTFQSLGTAVQVLDGPLGGLSSRINTLNAGFGRFGLAAGGALGALALLTGGYILSAAAAGNAEREGLRLNAVLDATAFAAGRTAAQLNRAAEARAGATLFDVSDVREAEAILLTFKNVQRETFDRGIELALDLSETFKKDLASSITLVGKALENPTIGMSALTEVGVSFSPVQREMIRNFEEMGEVAKAQGVILDTLAGQVGGAASRAGGGLAGHVKGAREQWTLLLEEIGRTQAVTGSASAGLAVIERILRNARGAVAGGDSAALLTIDDRLAINAEKLAKARQKLAEEEAKPLGLTLKPANRVASLEAERRRLFELQEREFEEMERAKTGALQREAERRQEIVVSVEDETQRLLLSLQQNRERKIIEERDKAIARLEGARPIAGEAGAEDKNAEIDRAIAARRELAVKQLGEVRTQAEKLAEADKKLIDGLRFQITLLGETEREQAALNAVRSLSANATAEERKEARLLALEIFDLTEARRKEKEIEDEVDKARQRGKDTIEDLLDPYADYNRMVREVTLALEEQTLTTEQLDRVNAKLDEKYRKLNPRLASIDRAYSDAAESAVDFARDVSRGESAIDSLTNALSRFEQILLEVLVFERFENFLRNIFSGGGKSGGGFLGFLEKAVTVGAGALGGGGSSGGGQAGTLNVPAPSSTGVGPFRAGGSVTGAPGLTRFVSPSLFDGAPRFRNGGFPGLAPDEVAAILHKGERVLTREESRSLRPGGGRSVSNNIQATFVFPNGDANSFRSSRGQIVADLTQMLQAVTSRG